MPCYLQIWFQNRRRKDVVANQKAADGIPVELPRTTTPEAQMVPPDVMSGVLRELMKYDGDYKKQLKMKAKPKSKSATDRAKPYDLSKSGHQRNRSDSQGYDTSPRANSVSSGGSPGYDYDAQGHFNKSPSLTCTMPMSAMFSHTSPEGFPASFSSTFSSTPSTGYHSNQSSPPQSVATPSAYQHSANSSASSTPPAGANQSVRSPYNSSPINLAGASAISPENQQNVRLSEDQQSLCGKSSSPINETSKSTQHSIPSNEQLDMIAPPNAVAPQDFDLPPMYPLSALESPKNKSPQNESEKSNELDSSSDSCHDPATSSSQSLSVDIPTSSEGPPSSTPATTTPYSWHVPAGHMMSGASGGENAMTSHYPHQMSAYPPNQTIPPNFHGYGGFGEMNMRSYSGGNDSKVNLDRVFPFPLVAEQAMRFTSFPPYTPEGYGSSMKNEATGSYRDHYQPLLIASYANPYYGQDVKGESQCKSDVYIIWFFLTLSYKTCCIYSVMCACFPLLLIFVIQIFISAVSVYLFIPFAPKTWCSRI